MNTSTQGKESLWQRGIAQRYQLSERPKSSVLLYDWLTAHAQAAGDEGAGAAIALTHRKLGKSTAEIARIDADSRLHPGADYALVAETKEHAQRIGAIYQRFMEGCPPSVAPRPRDSKYEIGLHGGGTLFLFGGNSDHIRTARGLDLRGAVVDEAGQQEDLEETLRGILFPALAGRWRGWLVCSGTPPRYAGHPFETLYHRSVSTGLCFFMSGDQNPDLPPGYLTARARELGGRESLYFRREWLCEFVYDDTLMAVPEWQHHRETLTRPVPMPEKPRDWYWALDSGGRDLHAVLWAYYEPEDDTVRYKREWAESEVTAKTLAAAVRQVEADLWQGKPPQSLTRIGDPSNYSFLLDLAAEGLDIASWKKDKKDAKVQLLRDLVREEKMWVDTSCKRFARTLLVARRRDVNRYEFEREKRPEDGMVNDPENPWIGHADLLDSGIEIARIVEHGPGQSPHVPQAPDWGVGLPQFAPEVDAGLNSLSRLLQRPMDLEEF